MQKLYNKLKNKRESINAFLFISFLFLPLIIRPIKAFTGWTWLIWPLTIIFLLLSIMINQVWKRPQYYLIFFTIGFLMLLNILLVPYKDEALSIFIEMLKFSIVALFLGLPKIDYKKMSIYWYYLGIITLFIFSFDIQETINNEISYMFFGISIILSFGGIFYRFIQNKKWYDLFLALYAFLLVTLVGNRGALITVIAITVSMAFIYGSKRRKIFLVGSGIFAGIMYISGLLKMILKTLNSFLLNININSRTIDKIIMQMEEGVAAASSGRDRVTMEAIEMIKNAGFMPKGVGYYQSQTHWLYPHNIFLEMTIIFGFLSIFILLGIIYANFRFYHREKSPTKKDMVTLLLLISITRLLLSDSFLIYTPFWMWMVLILKDDLALWSQHILTLFRKKLDRKSTRRLFGDGDDHV